MDINLQRFVDSSNNTLAYLHAFLPAIRRKNYEESDMYLRLHDSSHRFAMMSYDDWRNHLESV